MTELEKIIQDKAPNLKEFWFDVDGVMTPQGVVTIYDVHDQDSLVGFERADGIVSTRLVPCDEQGVPLLNVIEYLAGYAGEPIMEGYRFDPRDGKVVEYLVQNGFPVYFISGRKSPCVEKRARVLGAIPFLGLTDKLSVMREHTTVSFEEILFVADGIQDYEALMAVGLAIAPKDASPEAILAADCLTDAKGGGGVLNEVITPFLKARGIWPA
jgi:3-deoxy-D-manno-octulosonate 8-phosphate phosphatase (KDO 8-P phosphatase)